MNTLSDSDLSDISNPLSLSINSEKITESGNDSLEAVDYSGISKFLLNTIKRGIVFNPDIPEDTTKLWETQEKDTPLFFVLLDSKESQIIIKNFLIDPITLKDTTATDYNEVIHIDIRSTQAENTHSIEYPRGAINSSNTSSTYTITSGNTEMRNTYINQTRTTIQPDSWVDIKPR